MSSTVSPSTAIGGSAAQLPTSMATTRTAITSSDQQQQKQQHVDAANTHTDTDPADKPSNDSNPEQEQQHEQVLAMQRRRAAALAQADDVLEAVGGSMQLDGLNLLGVVASPRRLPGLSAAAGGSGGGGGGILSTNSFHGRYNPAAAASSNNNHNNNNSPNLSAHATSAAVAANHVSSSHNTEAGASGTSSMGSDYLTDTYHTIEMTLSHVTEQMDVWNQLLEDFSRQILEDDDVAHQALPESQLTRDRLPVMLQADLELQSQLQRYLETCGPLAQKLQQRKLYRNNGGDSNSSETPTSGTTNLALPHAPNDDSSSSNHNYNIYNDGGDPDDEEIPGIFWQADFDLTDPDTFAQLLLLDPAATATALGQLSTLNNNGSNDNGGGENSNGDDQNDESNQIHSESSVNVQDWFPLVPPDAFGGYLDKVELALLQQVRSKSGTFFEESLRFAQLQEWIQSLLMDVTHVQETTDKLHKDLLQPMNTIPVCDAQRTELGRLLAVVDKADDMLHCKSSIAGYLSAQDDLTAIEQIQYGRRLLAGGAEEETNNVDDNNDDNNNTLNGAPVEDTEKEAVEPVELHRLQALRTVSEQLNQYEQLVVTNLREELVEIFLGWNTAAVSSIYAVTGNGNGGGSTPTNKSATASLSNVQQRVCEIIGALQKCHGLEPTRKAYGNRLQDTIRMTVRTTVGEFASDSGAESNSNGPLVSITAGATSMSLERFLDCLDMLFEQLLALLTSAAGVDEFCVSKDFSFNKETGAENGARAGDGPSSVATPMAAVVTAAVELSSKSISELLRLRKDAHSLVTLDEMKKIWDTCVSFTQQIEKLSGHKAVALRSTLMAQAKAFVERKHESNMSALVAALDSERWTQCEVSAERQAALTRLCSGRAVLSTTLTRDNGVGNTEKKPDAEVEGIRYKTVWSCLLLLEMVMNNVAAAAHFQSLASNVISKISELLRLFNSRTTHLVLGAGAIHSTARLKSINAKHLSLVTQCLGMTIATMPHVRAALMAQMPQRQHTLLSSLDQIKKELGDHNEKVLNKFVTIIGGIVEHGLAPKIAGTDFDRRAKANPPVDGVVPCCIFLEGVSTNTRKMHQVLSTLLPPDHLQDVFSRIFAFVDHTVPSLLVSTAENAPPAKVTPKKGATSSPSNAGTKATTPTFSLPQTEAGKERLLIEVGIMTEKLNGLDGVQPWDFTAVNVLERKLEYSLKTGPEMATETGVATDPGEGEQNDVSVPDDAPGSPPGDRKDTGVEEKEALVSVGNESSIEGEHTETATLDAELGTVSTDGNETAVDPFSVENVPSREGEQIDAVIPDAASGTASAEGNAIAVEGEEGLVDVEIESSVEGEQNDSVTPDAASLTAFIDGNESVVEEQEALVSVENGSAGGEQTDATTPDAASGTASADEKETVDEEKEAPAPVESLSPGKGEQTESVARDAADGEETADGEQEASASVENGSSGENPSNLPS